MTPEAIAAKRREERVKLASSALSTVGVGVFVAGGAAPFFLGRGSMAALGVAFGVGAALHMAAQVLLGYVVKTPSQRRSAGDDL